MKIEVVSKMFIEKIIDGIKYKLFNYDEEPKIKAVLSAYDQTSGIKEFSWRYQKENGASDVSQEFMAATINAVQDEEDLSKYTATIKLSESDIQLRGYLQAAPIDEHDDKSETITNNDEIIVVDSIVPNVDITIFDLGSTRPIDYYNQPIGLMVSVDETNFFEEDLTLKIICPDGDIKNATPNWKPFDNSHHEVTYAINDDGEYAIIAEYIDKSGNRDTFISKQLVLDTAKSTIAVDYKNKNSNNTLRGKLDSFRLYTDDVQTAEIKITEHNFNPKDVKISVKAQDAGCKTLDIENLISKSEWLSDGDDTHIMAVVYPDNAHYAFDIECKDLSGNKTNKYVSDYFAVNKTRSQNLKIESRHNVLDKIVNGISFGFNKCKNRCRNFGWR